MVSRQAFTVLELIIVISIIAVLAALAFPAYSTIKAKAQLVQCNANLKSLYLGAEHYLQDNNQWPQIAADPDADDDGAGFAQAWIAALAPYGIEKKTWICPTTENLLGNPDYVTTGNQRIDYQPMPFDDKPTTPHQWPRQPWFVETIDAHGHGQLIIFTDGSISDLKSAASGG